jgi:hypothetical protein
LKIRLDAMMSYRVANAVKAFVSNRQGGLMLDFVGDHHPPRTSDPTWIKEFATSGGIAIISGDGRIRQNQIDLVAYIESGLIGIWVPSNFDDLKGYGQAALILRWFPMIVEKIKGSIARDCWQMPMSWTPTMNGFKRLMDPRDHPSAKQANPPAIIHQFRRNP